MKRTSLLATAIAIVFGFASCSKDNDTTGQSTMKIQMTDAPGDWDQVNIDLQQVVVKFDKDTNSWINLQSNAGVYDLLQLQNGIDTLIAQGTFPLGQTVKEIRLIVGSNNTIMVDSLIYPLTIPSGSESGLKIKINKKLNATVEDILIDFDAALSIKEENGSYKLMPVIKLK